MIDYLNDVESVSAPVSARVADDDVGFPSTHAGSCALRNAANSEKSYPSRSNFSGKGVFFSRAGSATVAGACADGLAFGTFLGFII